MKLMLPLLLALLCATLGACDTTPEATESRPVAPLRVGATTVHRGEISDVLTVSGETAALSTVRLASPVIGYVTMLNARAGDRLDKGEVAFRVISFENEAALRGFDLLAGTTRLSAEEQGLTQRLQKDLAARTVPLRAPFNAVVAERFKNPGEVVAQGDVVLELFDPSALYVLAQVPVEAAARVHPGLPVEVTIGATLVRGEVTALGVALVPQSLTVPVRIALVTPATPPLLHAAVQCRITLAHDADALLIPRSALISTDAAGRGTVMVAVADAVQRRTIQLGIRTHSLVEVRAGLSAGEVVLSEGQYALPEGTRIEPVSSPAA